MRTKKSKSDISPPKQELDLLKNRLKEAKALYKSLKEETRWKHSSPVQKRIGDIGYTESSWNVFHDLGLSNPEEALAKAEIARKIHDIIKEKKLTQAKAAKILEISQPKVSLLLRGYLTDFFSNDSYVS